MKKTNSVKFFDTPFWLAVLERLRSIVGTQGIQAFQYKTGLNSFRLDLVLLGRKGMTVESLVKLCEVLRLSPTWLLFGLGPADLMQKQHPVDIQVIVEDMIYSSRKLPDKERRQFEKTFPKIIEGLKDGTDHPPRPRPHVPPHSDRKIKTSQR